jgi:diguanylate cyclase (GGDEF)-like protein/PAS domain S-box-containing protein
MRLSIGQKLTFAFAAAVAILFASGVVASRNTRELLRTADMVSHTQAVLASLDGVVAYVADVESGLRAYSTAGDSAARSRISAASESVRSNLGSLEELARREQEPHAEFAAFQRSVSEFLMSAAGAGHRIAGLTGTAPVLDAAADGRTAMLALIRLQARAIRDQEQRRLVERSALSHASADRTLFIVRLGLYLTILLAPLSFFIVRNDFALRREMEVSLRESEARFRAAADGSMDAFYVLHAVRDANGRVIDFEFADLNARAEGLLGLDRAALLGQRLCELLPINRTAGFLDKYVHVMKSGQAMEEEFEVPSSALPGVWVHQQVVPLADGVAITSRDISERKRHEEALRSLSLIDDLTRLYNRRGFLTLAQQQLKLARRAHRELLLLFVDMDDFKSINDTFGHQEGDEALRRTAGVLRRTFRDSDILARIGGDEFVALVADTGDNVSEIIINRLRSELRERNEQDGYLYRLSFSVGVARFDPLAPPSIEELLATADSMLYEQKKYRREMAVTAG